MMKWLLIFVGLFGAIGGWIYKSRSSDWFPVSPPENSVSQRTKRVSSDSETIFATGFVEGNNEAARLRFEVPGRLVEMLVSEGDRVEKGDLLAQLDSTVLEQKVIQARADLELAKAEWLRLKNSARKETRELAQAKVRVAQAEVQQSTDHAERTRKLFERSVASEGEWKKAHFELESAKARCIEAEVHAEEVGAPAREDDLQIAQARIQIAEAALDHAELLVKRTGLYAPHAGTVLDVGFEVGEMINASDTRAVVTFSNLDRLRVRAYVEELHALKVRVGDSVNVTVEGLPNQTFSGHVVFCAPQMAQKQHRTHRPDELVDIKTREIVIELEKNSGLVVGLPVEVEIVPSKPGMPQIPETQNSVDLGLTEADPSIPRLEETANKDNLDFSQASLK